MKKLIIILAISIVANISVLNAQQNYTSFQYAIGFGSGDLSDYISKASFRGFLFEYKNSFINENILIGVDIAWNAFYENVDDVYTEGDASISGKQWRYSNHFPLLISAEYLFLPDNSLRPFVNFGLGTMYTQHRLDMNVYSFEQDAWSFAIKPEIGAIYDMGNNSGLKLAAKYYTGFKSGDLETQSYFSISAGIVFNF